MSVESTGMLPEEVWQVVSRVADEVAVTAEGAVERGEAKQWCTKYASLFDGVCLSRGDQADAMTEMMEGKLSRLSISDRFEFELADGMNAAFLFLYPTFALSWSEAVRAGQKLERLFGNLSLHNL